MVKINRLARREKIFADFRGINLRPSFAFQISALKF